MFETEGDFDPDPIPADRLSQLLREHNIPAAVLNACQSGMVDDAANDAFASVAASLLRAGVRSVVAMSHAVMVSGAREFIPPFYRRLFETGSLAEAARAGRREMFAHPERLCARGRFPLQDWLVPVVYEQVEVSFDFVADADPPTDDAPDLPAPPEVAKSPFGFVGRDRELLQLERALHRDPAGILFHGLGGVGKTMLVWGFLQWLADTGGLTREPLWFTFSEIQSAEYVLNRIGERFYGEGFATLVTEEKLDRLVAALAEEPRVLVWDNFESAAAMDEEAREALLSEEDREAFRTLLHRLRGTETKVLITSRSVEDWLGGPAHVQRHSLGGLQGEERWRFCEGIVADLPGVSLDREDDGLKELMVTFRGHSLAMRVVLPRLADRSPDDLRETVENNLDDLDPTDDEVRDRLYATLGLVEDVLDDELRELLIPLRLHEQFVDANLIETMAERTEGRLTREQTDRGLKELANVGVLQNAWKDTVYAVHPALSGYLRARDQDHDRELDNLVQEWTEAFVHTMASGADHFAPKSLHEQRLFIGWHEPDVIHAAHLADQHGWKEKRGDLINVLASSARNRRVFDTAEHLYEQVLEIRKQLDDEFGVASAYHELGRVAQERWELDEAEKLYHKSVEIKKRLDDEYGVAATYHHLGIVAEMQRKLDEAEEWYRKSAEIFERLGDEHGTAKTHGHTSRKSSEPPESGFSTQSEDSSGRMMAEVPNRPPPTS